MRTHAPVRTDSLPDSLHSRGFGDFASTTANFEHCGDEVWTPPVEASYCSRRSHRSPVRAKRCHRTSRTFTPGRRVAPPTAATRPSPRGARRKNASTAAPPLPQTSHRSAGLRVSRRRLLRRAGRRRAGTAGRTPAAGAGRHPARLRRTGPPQRALRHQGRTDPERRQVDAGHRLELAGRLRLRRSLRLPGHGQPHRSRRRRVRLPPDQRRRFAPSDRRLHRHRSRRAARSRAQGRLDRADGRSLRLADRPLRPHRRPAGHARMEAAGRGRLHRRAELRAEHRRRRRTGDGTGQEGVRGRSRLPRRRAAAVRDAPGLRAHRSAAGGLRAAGHRDGLAARRPARRDHLGRHRQHDRGALPPRQRPGRHRPRRGDRQEGRRGAQGADGRQSGRRQAVRVPETRAHRADRHRRRRRDRRAPDRGDLAVRRELPRVRLRSALPGRVLLPEPVRGDRPGRGDHRSAAGARPGFDHQGEQGDRRGRPHRRWSAYAQRHRPGPRGGHVRPRQPGRLAALLEAAPHQAGPLLQPLHQPLRALRRQAGHQAGAVAAAERDSQLPQHTPSVDRGAVRRADAVRGRHVRRHPARVPGEGRRRVPGCGVPLHPGPRSRCQPDQPGAGRRDLRRRPGRGRQLGPGGQADLRAPEAVAERGQGLRHPGDARRTGRFRTGVHRADLRGDGREAGRELPGRAVDVRPDARLRGAEDR